MTEPIRGSRPTETAVGRDHGFLAALWRLPQLGLQQRRCLGWDPPGEGPRGFGSASTPNGSPKH